MTEKVLAAPVYADRTTGTSYDSARSMVDAYLHRFGEATGFPLPPLDDEGYTQVRRGSALIGINVLEDRGFILFLAPVMAIPHDNLERFYRRLLELSFLATSDAAFAIDAVENKVFVRSLRRLSALDYEEFEDLLNTVGTVADEWDDVLVGEFGRGGG